MNRLMEKLSQMLPKQKDPEQFSGGMKTVPFQLTPIRDHAKAFAASMPEMPKDYGELASLLWVFGERVAGDMEKRMNYALKLSDDLAALRPPEPIIFSRDSEASHEDI